MIARAFTLIELIVVVGIIVILCAIIVPVFAQAKARSVATSCLSNMRSIGQGLSIYTIDNDGSFSPLMGVESTDFISESFQLECPAVSKPKTEFHHKHFSGYGMNLMVMGEQVVESPSLVVLAHEISCLKLAGSGSEPYCNGALGGPDEIALPLNAPSNATGVLGEFGSRRHLRKGHYVMVDGHAKLLSIGQFRLPGWGTLGHDCSRGVWKGPEDGYRFCRL